MNEQKLGGRYLYCIIDAGTSANFGKIGIEENEVYTVSYQDVGALVHKCVAEVYVPKDEKTIINYVQKHNSVIDLAFNKFDAIVPLRFNTIVIEKDGGSNEVVEKWLADQYSDLRKKLNELKGKEEYGVQIVINTEEFAQEILSKNQRIIELKKKAESIGSPGVAYLHKQKFEIEMKKALEEKRREIASEVHSLIKAASTDTRFEKARKVEKTTVLKFSCLVEKEKAKQFSRELEKMNNSVLSVRIVGPWAPYSFA